MGDAQEDLLAALSEAVSDSWDSGAELDEEPEAALRIADLSRRLDLTGADWRAGFSTEQRQTISRVRASL